MSSVKAKFIESGELIKSNLDPVAGEDLARKSYVDAKAEAEAADKLPLSGGQMSGVLDMDSFAIENLAAPVEAGDAVNKAYVDSAVGGIDMSTKADLVDGKVPASQLPSYVDDVLEYADLAAFPATGESAKIYVALDTNKTYRWGGSVYVEISASPGSTDAVAEGSTNLYYTDVRAAAAAPVQSVAGKTGTVTLAKADVGLGSVDNTADMDKPVSTAMATALSGKQNSLGTGTTAQFLRGDLTWAAIPKAAKVYTVGVDANTIAGCIALCTSPTATNNYIIEIPPGSYTEDLTIPGNVHLKGLANPSDSLSVKITGQHTITGASNNTINNRVCLANILFVSAHATTALLAISGTLAETEVQVFGCFLQNANVASTAKLISLGLYGKMYANNTKTRMAGSGNGGTHFTISAGGALYTQYGLDVDGGSCAIDMTGQGYAQIVYAILSCQGASTIKIAANGMVLMQASSVTNNAAIGNGVNLLGAGASFFATHCVFNVLDNAASYVVTGVAGSFFGMFANSYSHIAGVVTRNVKIGTSLTQLRYSGSLASSDIGDFVAAARAATVADAIADGVTTVAPSQNVVFDQLALKLSTSLKGAANGLAELGADGKIPSAQLSAIAITDTFVVASQAAMLALTAEKGDVAVRTDLSKSFILKADGASTLANWQELLSPTDAVLSVNGQSGIVVLSSNNIAEGGTNLYYTDVRAAAAAPVQSVSGKTGAVSLVKGDVGLGSVDNTSDLDKPVSTATALALSGKANSTHTHVSSDITDFDSSAAAAAPVQSVAGKTGAVSLDKSDFGLGLVDNTSDADKPVSTAMQDALDDKQDSLGTAGSDDYLAGDLTWKSVAKFKKDVFVLSATNISNGYVDCSYIALEDSMRVLAGGVEHHEVESYSLSIVGGVTRITFLGDLITGDSALVAGDVARVQYQH